MEKPHKCVVQTSRWVRTPFLLFLLRTDFQFVRDSNRMSRHLANLIFVIQFQFPIPFVCATSSFFAKYQKFLLSVAFSDIILLSGPTAQRFHRRIWNCDLPLHSSEKLIYLRNSAKHTLSSNMLIIVMSFISTPYTWLIQPKHIYLKF